MKQISTLVLVCLLLHTNIFAQTPTRYDIIIDELMADPTPATGLPGNEWIELHNTSSITINLQGWKIGDGAVQSGPMPAYNLKPDSFIIVCTSSALSAMLVFGPAISVTSFPTLDNAGDIIYLRSPQNMIIHSVNYSDNWYQNELKKEGGWTLEMMDVKNPCSGFSNWTSSTDPKGGTPGKKNAVAAINPDTTDPQLLRAYATDSVNIVLVFDEPLDSLKAATINNYSVSDGIGIPQKAILPSPIFDQVQLKLLVPLQAGKIYAVVANTVTDCAGNTISSKNSARIAISSIADSFDVVINEILFNPISTGVDYVELFNRSKKSVDLKNIYIANRNTAGLIGSITQISKESYLFFPGDFMVITSDASIIKRDFVTLNPAAFAEPGSTPSYNDDKGDVIITNAQGKIIDELVYDEKWHFKLIDNREGVALERINYNAPTQQSDNWHSAATSVHYGTPTYKNSQTGIGQELKGDINISPAIISPDNDGRDDYATIEYSFPTAGYVANITIFDAAGRPVRYLQRNALCGIRGNFQWDGLGENNQQLLSGIYIFYTELFNLNGKKKKFKNVIVLSRRK